LNKFSGIKNGGQSHNSPTLQKFSVQANSKFKTFAEDRAGHRVEQETSETFDYIEDYERMTMSDPEHYISLEARIKN
jgi:hypothetical protein